MHAKGTGHVGLLHLTGFYCKYYIKFMKNKAVLLLNCIKMNPVVQFNGFEPDHINEDRLVRTLRLVPRESSSVSYGELWSVLEAENLKPDDIEAIFKVSASLLIHLIHYLLLTQIQQTSSEGKRF